MWMGRREGWRGQRGGGRARERGGVASERGGGARPGMHLGLVHTQVGIGRYHIWATFFWT